MRILVTGGNGFFGRRLIKRLLESGAEVLSVDLCHSVAFDQHPNLSCINMDLASGVDQKLPLCDIVFHAAALLGVDFVEENPFETVLRNVTMFQALKENLLNPACHFVFFSTSEVYGDDG